MSHLHRCAWLVWMLCSACEAPAESPAQAIAHEPRWSEVTHPRDLSLLEAPAWVVAAPDGEARIAASHSARVVRVHVRAGDQVEAGAPIVDVVMPAVLEAAARWTSVGPRRTLRTARRTELATLEVEGLVDRARVFEQDTELRALDAQQAEALATLRSASITTREASRSLREGYTTLRTPIGGVVSEVSASTGEVRDATGASFATIVVPVPARIEVRFAHAIPSEASLRFVGVDGATTALDPTPIAHVIDPDDGTQRVWLAAANHAPLPTGLRGRVVVSLDAASTVVEIDAAALVLVAGEAFVEKRTESGIERVPVEVITASSTRALVRAALAPGDRLSLEPARVMRAAE